MIIHPEDELPQHQKWTEDRAEDEDEEDDEDDDGGEADDGGGDEVRLCRGSAGRGPCQLGVCRWLCALQNWRAWRTRTHVTIKLADGRQGGACRPDRRRVAAPALQHALWRHGPTPPITKRAALRLHPQPCDRTWA